MRTFSQCFLVLCPAHAQAADPEGFADPPLGPSSKKHDRNYGNGRRNGQKTANPGNAYRFAPTYKPAR
jgi:hypothetical protein